MQVDVDIQHLFVNDEDNVIVMGTDDVCESGIRIRQCIL